MSRDKQIEEMAKAMCGNGMPNGNCVMDDEPCNLECVYGCCAVKLYAKGYCKQCEGEWHAKDNINGRCSIATCSNCGTTKGLAVLLPIETVTRDFPYCEKCGAKMKGGESDA